MQGKGEGGLVPPFLGAFTPLTLPHFCSSSP